MIKKAKGKKSFLRIYSIAFILPYLLSLIASSALASSVKIPSLIQRPSLRCSEAAEQSAGNLESTSGESLDNRGTVFGNALLDSNSLIEDDRAQLDLQNWTNVDLWNFFHQYIDEFNESNGGKWLASAVEFGKEIFIIQANDFGCYLDLDGDNGYLVVNCDGVVSFAVSGDLPSLKNCSILGFSSESGFEEYDENSGFYEPISGINVPLIYPSSSSSLRAYSGSSLFASSAYAGQLNSGDGWIYDLDDYVSAKYGSNYVITQRQYLTGCTWSSMWDTSVFYVDEYKNGNHVGTYTEGNCVINSMFSMLSNLSTGRTTNGTYRFYNKNLSYVKGSAYDYSQNIFQHDDKLVIAHGSTDFIYSETKVEVENGTTVTNTYSYFYHPNTYDKYNYNYGEVIKNQSLLYLRLRDGAIDKGYDNRGMITSDAVTIMQDVCEYYGYSSEFVDDNNTNNDAIINIQYGIPSIIGVSNNSVYSGHAMCLLGYAQCRHYIKLFGLSIPIYQYFWDVDSGWGPNDNDTSQSEFRDSSGNLQQWFDPPSSTTLEFICAKRSTLTLSYC